MYIRNERPMYISQIAEFTYNTEVKNESWLSRIKTSRISELFLSFQISLFSILH